MLRLQPKKCISNNSFMLIHEAPDTIKNGVTRFFPDIFSLFWNIFLWSFILQLPKFQIVKLFLSCIFCFFHLQLTTVSKIPVAPPRPIFFPTLFVGPNIFKHNNLMIRKREKFQKKY